MHASTYDADGHLLRQPDAVQSGTAFAYDMAGNRTVYRLDDLERIIGIVKADGSIRRE